MRYIGDIHGAFDYYALLIAGVEASVQVGDHGLGFRVKEDEMAEHEYNFPVQHRFIRGNHDKLEDCQKNPRWIPDGTIEGNTMYIGGAKSVDRYRRTEGIDWWADEELPYDELSDMVDLYEKTKPEVMVTHTCPVQINEAYFSRVNYGGLKVDRTSQAFGTMLHIARPKLWIFGHFHHPADFTVEGTRFICLGINQTIDI